MESRHFLVRCDRLGEHCFVELPRAPLPPGSVELRVDRFGLTANNATYGALGESASYWRLFPSPHAGWGRIPVWGFGTVVRSELTELPVGERFYGVFPMSSHVVVQPRRLDDQGFVDGAAHRRALSGVYNQYLRTTRDPNYRADTEAVQAVLRPVFATSFFLPDYLQAHEWFGADAVVLSSASSKLAYGMAFVLADARRAGREVIGLTSAPHAEFVRRLALYDRVATYDDVAALPRTRRTVFIDIAGSPMVRAAVHHHLGEALQHSLLVGLSHGVAATAAADLPGPVPVAFFAPSWIEQRIRHWTPAGMQERLAAAWHAFLVPVLDASRGWLAIASGEGSLAVARAYDDLLGGRGRPEIGHVLALGHA